MQRGGAVKVGVHRSRVMEDAFAQLGALGAALKGPLFVTFTNEHGMREAGACWVGTWHSARTQFAPTPPTSSQASTTAAC